MCVHICVYSYLLYFYNYYHIMHSEINTKSDAIGQMIREAPTGVRDVIISRPTRENNFGFVLLLNTGHQGYSIGMHVYSLYVREQNITTYTA